MAIFLLQIPVDDYEGTDTYYQPVYLEADIICPNKAQVLKVLEDLHETDSQYPTYLGSWMQAITVVKSCARFPRLTCSSHVQTSEQVQTKFGPRFISINRITPIKLPTE